MKLIRNFFGAFLGAMFAIWPAATWNEPWLLLFGAVFGWLMGYHGDRVIGSLIRGWRQARRVGFQTYLIAAVKRNIFARWLVTPGDLDTSFYDRICTLLRFSANWFEEHSISVLRFLGGLAGASLFVAFMWNFIGTFLIEEVGSTTRGANGKLITVTEFHVFWNTLGLSIILGFFPTIITATIISLQGEWSSIKSFYQIWERYASRGPVLFFFDEALRFLWIEVWLIWTVISALFVMMVAFMSLFLGVVLTWSGIVFGLKLAWRAIRLNRDYGVISLGIALLVGTITFYTCREDLVADTWFRLGASVIAGFVAGTISFLITWLCGLMFRHSTTMRRIAVQKDYLSSKDLMKTLLNKVINCYWKQNKRLLPIPG